MRRLFAVLLVGMLGLAAQAEAGTTPMTVVQVANGLNRPIYVTAPPGDYERLFIAEQSGVIRILNLLTQTVNPTPFLNINSLVANLAFPADERGFLGMAFDPDYAMALP